ncbi:MAG: protease modulator HflC [Pelagibacterales bacterium]|nr:protease modulator HflC [Pelagibacterales bacterium]|tara:strand:- start:253 stop:1125 length:873 start_codon:yes stop_codon:yes gene_type:complete
MTPKRIASIVLILIVVILGSSSFFYVDQRVQAIVLQFGEPVRLIKNPGLQFKIPLMQNVEYFDKRLILFDNPREEIISADKKRLIVDAFARYRIVDPLRYYQSVRYESALRNRLGSILNDSLRQVLGRVPLNSVISDNRANLMDEVGQIVAEEAKEFGLKIEDVRIKRADLPTANSEAIFRRMQTERQQEAAQFRAEGEEEARKIRAESERERTVLLANAERDGEILRGQGDAGKNKILGEAFGRDPDFFSFYRSMQAYVLALDSEDTTMVLSPDSEFFNFFGDLEGIKD